MGTGGFKQKKIRTWPASFVFFFSTKSRHKRRYAFITKSTFRYLEVCDPTTTVMGTLLLPLQITKSGPYQIYCTLNICSILHPLHSAAISDFIDSHSPDLFCLTETWIKPTTTFTELAHCTPPNCTLLSFPRTSPNNTCIGDTQLIGSTTIISDLPKESCAGY